MSEALKTVPPFFERQLTPPPLLPLLTSQTNVLYYASRPPCLLTQEGIEITPQKPTVLRRQLSSLRPTGTVYPPLPPGSRTVRFDTRERSPSSELSSDDTDGKVDKPRGDFGRPNSGGYSLGPAALGWRKNEFEQLRVRNYRQCTPSTKCASRTMSMGSFRSSLMKGDVTHNRNKKALRLFAML
jgi:hypothetical protein